MAVLNAAQRKALSDRVFAMPLERKYPIENLPHARAALSMVAAHGTPAEQAQVKAAVYKKWPELKPLSK